MDPELLKNTGANYEPINLSALRGDTFGETKQKRQKEREIVGVMTAEHSWKEEKKESVGNPCWDRDTSEGL